MFSLVTNLRSSIAGRERVDRTFSVAEHGIGELLHQCEKCAVLGGEVGLGLELYERGAIAADRGRDRSFAVLAVRAFGRLGQALLAQRLDGLVEVAIALDERLLAIHHARACCVA